MKPTPNSHKYPKFLVKESRDNLSQSILKLFKLEEWTQVIKKIGPFQEVPVQSNKAVLAITHHGLKQLLREASDRCSRTILHTLVLLSI